MQLHTLKNPHKKSHKIRIGRGGKRGTTSGRGTKGQKARAGRRIRPEMRDLIMKIPKRRGHAHTGPKSTEVSIKASIITKNFKAGDQVTPKSLLARGLIKRIKGKTPRVKILNASKLPTTLSFSGVTMTGKTEKKSV